jgi:fucose permease
VKRIPQHIRLLLLIYLCFISLGLPDGILGAAWPAIRMDMQQPLAAVGLMTMTMTVCSALSSLGAARLTRRWGTGPIVAASGLMTALALLGFAHAPAFGWLLALAVPLGLGAGAVDASINHFVAEHYSARHMNWLHGFWGVGASTGPLVMGVVMAQTGQWSAGVLTLGVSQLAIASVLWLCLPWWRHPLPKVQPLSLTEGPEIEPPHAPSRQHPRLRPRQTHAHAVWLAPLCFLLYVGAEAGAGLWAVSVLVQERGMGLALASAGLSLYFGAITLGRFGVGVVAHRMNNRQWVQAGLGLALAGASLMALPLPGLYGIAGLVLMGLGCAPIFPSLMHETAVRFPAELARTLVGRQMVFAYAGGSLLPAGMGLLATWVGLGWVMPSVAGLLLALCWVTRRLDQIT